MSFLLAVSLVSLLAILPALLSFRRTAGVQEFSGGCALSIAAIGFMMAAEALRLPLAAMLGYAGLIAAFLLLFLGLRRFLELPLPPVAFIALGLAGGTAGLVIALGGHDGLGARLLVIAGLGSGIALVGGIAMLDRLGSSAPAIRFVAIGALTIGCAAVVHALGPTSRIPSELPSSPAANAFAFSLALMQALFLPSLFLALVLAIQNRTIAELKTAIARDDLTGALSRVALIEEGERLFADCLARHRPAAFLLLDLDYFKQINDHYGHACGDMALAHFAGTVSTFLDGRGAFGRIGGEEFGVILPNHTEETAAALAEEICRIVRETPAGRAHQRIRLTVSIGIAAAEPGDTIMDVMFRADMALYESKADGRDRCSLARHRRTDASARALAAAAAQLRQADLSPQERMRQSA